MYLYICLCLSTCVYSISVYVSIYLYTQAETCYNYLKLNLAFPRDLFTLTCVLSCLMTPCRFISQKPPLSLSHPQPARWLSLITLMPPCFNIPPLFSLLPGSDLVIPSHDSFIKSFLSTYHWPGAPSGSEDTAVNKQTKILSLIDFTINK